MWEQWQERFGLPHNTEDVGHGHSAEEVDAVRIADADLLVGYHHEVTLATARYLGGVDEKELEREVDQSWDPPVTAGVRLISKPGRTTGDRERVPGRTGQVEGRPPARHATVVLHPGQRTTAALRPDGAGPRTVSRPQRHRAA